ncbi:MAG: hypothetical protein ACXW3F_04730 [Pyrinomonadaceae bacterium]
MKNGRAAGKYKRVEVNQWLFLRFGKCGMQEQILYTPTVHDIQ